MDFNGFRVFNSFFSTQRYIIGQQLPMNVLSKSSCFLEKIDYELWQTIEFSWLLFLWKNLTPMKSHFFLLIITLATRLDLKAQIIDINPVKPTPYDERVQAFLQRQQLKQTSLVKKTEFRSAGPSIMSGRVVDLEVNPSAPHQFYVAYASGGLWYTSNNGQSFIPLFDNQPVMTLGDIAVNWKHNILWAGTGENNSSRSSYAGTGLYVSYDQGKSWQHAGLGEMHHCGRIVLHPHNPDVLWVASMGHLYSPDKERGIFKTSDAGKTWKQVLFIDENTGAIDLVIDPHNPEVLYGALWHRTRRAWHFTESGNTSGIYKSTDGGLTWHRLNLPGSGFPWGQTVGRIGLDIFPGNSRIIYAILDNQARRELKKDTTLKLSKDTFRVMTPEAFLQLNDTLLNRFLREHGFEKEYTAQSVKHLVRSGKIKPSALVDYLEDANMALFETEVIGPEVYRSENGGITWRKMNQEYLDHVFYSYGYYFGIIRVFPDNDKRILTGGVPLLVSDDGGQTFRSIDAPNTHVDYHACWINPSHPDHMIIGTDGGVNITYDGGKTYFKANSPAVGQFYTVNVDMSTPYNIYGGLQDNGVWYGPSTYEASAAWHQYGQYPYKLLLGGDGMQIMIDPRDNNTVYAGYQFGHYFRINKTTGEMKSIRPKHKLGERPLRFNWQTPIWLSVHNPDILYMGSNKFHRSMNKGETFVTLSGDLTRGGRKGNVPYGTITTIHESPLRFGLIYLGTDDGLVHVSKDGGHTFTNISKGLPAHFWVSRVIASAHDTAVVYVSLNGYRWDHFAALIYRSSDFGKTWKRIGLNLPAEPVNVIRDDPFNQNILYVGTDHGAYVSLDRGETFMAFVSGLADAPVHDMVVHPVSRELILATHGRSLYIARVKELQQLNDSILQKDLHLFASDTIRWNKNRGKISSKWFYKGEKPIRLAYFSRHPSIRHFTITTTEGLILYSLRDTSIAGLNYLEYDLSVDSTAASSYYRERLARKDVPEDFEWKQQDDGRYYLLPGTYYLKEGQHTAPIIIKP
jgi:photosystem II stability/assembly factor-like uncharacterized protein